MTQKSARVLVALLLSFTVESLATAAFIDGVETFDGTVKDLVTWEEFQDSSITQNDAITIESAADYTTRSESVSVSELVRVVMGSIEDGARSQVYLTTNSGGTGESTGFDSKYLFVE